jgi:TRAP-type mannitol/chloroaromatic compound transport system permease small subunit
LQRILLTIERGLAAVTRMAGWISGLSMAVMIALIFANMTGRYVFGAGATWLQELEWYLLSLSVMSGIAYAMRYDDHVRVDIFSHRFSRTGKNWLDLVTMLVVALPVAILIIYYAWPFVEKSFLRGERSANRGGMPWLFLPKSMILVGFALIGAEALRQILALVRRLRFHYRYRRRDREGSHSAT